jgi:hypothetical protein
MFYYTLAASRSQRLSFVVRERECLKLPVFLSSLTEGVASAARTRRQRDGPVDWPINHQAESPDGNVAGGKLINLSIESCN